MGKVDNYTFSVLQKVPNLKEIDDVLHEMMTGTVYPTVSSQYIRLFIYLVETFLECKIGETSIVDVEKS